MAERGPSPEDDFNLMDTAGHAAPAFLVSNLDSPGEDTVFGRRTDADVSKFAQPFSAANNENGTPAEFDFHGITILLESDLSGQLADSDIVVTVHKDSGGQPGDLVYTLTSPATYTVQPDTHPVTFLAPPGSTLSSGITYWVKFEIAADSTFFTEAKYIYFKLATDDNEVQGPTTYNRWSIGDDSLWSPETLSWMDDLQSIQMSVLGSQRIRHPGLQHRPALPGSGAYRPRRQTRSVIHDTSWPPGTAVPPAQSPYQRCIPVPNTSHSGPARR